MCITLGHVTGALLVTHEDVTNLGFNEWVVRRKDASTRETEHHFHVLVLQRTDERLGSGKCLFH
jgi:hypothetical protein